MADWTQEGRQVTLQTALGGDELIVLRMNWREQLGDLFEASVMLRSQNVEIDAAQLLGTKMTIKLLLPEGAERFFCGYVSRFVQTAIEGSTAVYQAQLVPWLWFLQRTSDCTIFQEKESAEIVEAVFERHGFSCDPKLVDTYAKRDYCVQYRETDYDFISRTLERDGIYYFFAHADGEHTMTLVDDPGTHEPVSGFEKIAFREPGTGNQVEGQFISDWRLGFEVQSGSYSLNDFDYARPSADIQVRSLEQRSHEIAEMAVYDYPGEYTEISLGEKVATRRLQELQAQYETVEGRTNVRGLTTGATFELIEHPRPDQNRTYLVTSATYEIRGDDPNAGADGAGAAFDCRFTAMPADRPFRPQRKTPRPIVQGPQTAIVVGPEGEEITTDDEGMGCVKVHFHWDRRTDVAWNERSCWVRVAQISAGKGWGGITIPRKDQEVVVEFLEGDPDKPIITGRVYNAEQPPPYALPANNTQSGVKTRSAKTGGTDNFNEIRMEDKKGSEHFYIQAEKDNQILVKNDRSKSVGNDESMDVGHDRTRSVGNDENVTVGANRTAQRRRGRDDRRSARTRRSPIGADLSRAPSPRTKPAPSAANLTRTVGASETVTITAARTRTRSCINDMLNVGAAQEVTIGGAQAVSVGGAQEP